MDKKLRALERKLAQHPDDEALQLQWLRYKIQMDDAIIKTFYKVKKGDKYLSSSEPSFTPIGTQFKSKKEAVKALVRYQEKCGGGRRRNHQGSYPDAADAELHTYQIYTVEGKVEKINCDKEIKKIKLNAIRAKKRELEQQEKELMG